MERQYGIFIQFQEEAYEKILLPVAKLSSVYIRQKDKEIKIGKRELNTCLEKELLDEFYGEKCEKYLNVSFLTPTSFKRDGKYVIIQICD